MIFRSHLFIIPLYSAALTSLRWFKISANEWGCSQFIALHLCHSYFLILSHHFSAKSLPQDAILLELIQQKLPRNCSSERTAPVRVCTTGPIPSPSGTDCSRVGPSEAASTRPYGPGSKNCSFRDFLWAAASYRPCPLASIGESP